MTGRGDDGCAWPASIWTEGDAAWRWRERVGATRLVLYPGTSRVVCAERASQHITRKRALQPGITGQLGKEGRGQEVPLAGSDDAPVREAGQHLHVGAHLCDQWDTDIHARGKARRRRAPGGPGGIGHNVYCGDGSVQRREGRAAQPCQLAQPTCSCWRMTVLGGDLCRSFWANHGTAFSSGGDRMSPFRRLPPRS